MSKLKNSFETTSKIAKTGYEQALANAKELAAASHASSTIERYESDWRHFLDWCQAAKIYSDGISPLPTNDETIATYLGSLVNAAPGTVKCRVCAIRFIHKRTGHSAALKNTPIFDAVYQGYLRRWASTNRARQSAATEERLKLMVDVWQEGQLALRNRAILLVGFDAALRRSEITSLDVEHRHQTEEGVELYLPTSKADQFGQGVTIELLKRQHSEYCPVKSLDSWLNQANISTGPIFRRFHRHGDRYELGQNRLSGKSIYNLVKESAKRAGLQGNFGAHSLRRGFINSAVRKCQSLTEVQRHARHKSLETTSKYLHSMPSDNHPGARLLE